MLARIMGRLSRRPQHTTLPDYLIIGAQRGGTTSLHHALAMHPDVLPASVKEVHFFDKRYHLGLNWYRARFPNRDHAAQRAGEASPYYLFHPLVPGRVQAHLPGVKLIVLLRNPVDRALSHYHLAVQHGYENLPFVQALERESLRLAGEAETIRLDPTYHSRAHQTISYQARGRYAEQLENWFAHFTREQFLILKSEDFYEEPARSYAEVLAFLGLRDWQPPHFARHNAFKYNDMDARTRQRLTESFAVENERLYRLLGRDLGWK